MSEYIIEWFDIGGQLTRLREGNVPLVLWPKLIREERRREEIVRCRDCKWFTPEYRYEEEREYGVMEELVEPPDCGNPERCSHHYDSITGKVVPVHIVTDPDGFCAWGERKGA